MTKGKVAVVDDRYYPMLMTLGSWCLHSNRYAATRLRGQLWLMHDLIMQWAKGKTPKGTEVDHRDRNKLNNRLRNLRYATSSQNHANVLKRSNNTSGYKGVFWHKGASKWMAQIKYQKRLYYLGLFMSRRAAARAYDKAHEALAGEYACKNNA